MQCAPLGPGRPQNSLGLIGLTVSYENYDNTYFARPMCETCTVIFCRHICRYPSPHTKKLATPQLMSPYRRKKKS